ncbi:hypothetical protein [Methylobacterium oxalidis]|nr:hypothetical protein [Methylobacterium oxalidis]GJE35504.1 hypothetical protein LDDCCGHA_5722 [Methylobacterium oxalidis]
MANVLIKGIVLDEACAREFARAASHLEATGVTSTADAMRTQARLHRVKSLELQGKLAALGDQYGIVFPNVLKSIP